MSHDLEGKDASLWIETTRKTNFTKLTVDDATYDVAVVGGGITGVVAAYYAQQRGLKVVLVEKNRLVEWTTGGTTAKLSSQHYLIYDYLMKRHSESTAQAFADANEKGIDAIEALAKELDIDCDFSRRSAYVYSVKSSSTNEIKAEVEAATKLGLPASFETTTDLPFDVAAAIKFSNQAQFHPRKFLLGLVDRFTKGGGVVYENTKATDVTPGEVNTVVTEVGDIKAKYVLQASGEPFWHNDIFDGFMWMKMSYALAVTLKDEAAYPKSMYITTDKPMRTIRSADYNGQPVMIFGGESHELDNDNFNPDKYYKNLIDDVHKKYDVDKVLFRWLAGDYMPYDRIPYIGAMPGSSSIYTVTGYRAWGLAWAMSAAEAIVQDIVGKPVDWVKPFSLERLKEPLSDTEKVTGL